MQNNRHLTYFGKLDLPASYGAGFELRKYKRTIATNFLEAWKPKLPFLSHLECSVKSLESIDIILTDFIGLLEYLFDCQLSGYRTLQLAWGVHVSQRQIEDYGVGLIAPQTPQKLNQASSF
jgi:hypothetical protein